MKDKIDKCRNELMETKAKIRALEAEGQKLVVHHNKLAGKLEALVEMQGEEDD